MLLTAPSCTSTAPRRADFRGARAAVPGWVAFVLATASLSCQGAVTPTELSSLSLEELGDLRITSVSKKPERLAEAAASVFVITAEDIRRAGAITLPAALRLAPNLHVAQTSAAGYAISARGFNGSNSSAPNKLLVLIDGRSVYTPLFSGVFWDAQDVLMENIERIEVISGPGSTLWGTNAVNGVINVITRPARDTRGQLVTAIAGSDDSGGAYRYGGSLGSGDFRINAKYSDRKHTETADGSAVNDAGHRAQVGFRADWGDGQDQRSLLASVYGGSQGQPLPGAISVTGLDVELGDLEFSGANLTGRWDRALAGGGRLGLQAYLDHTQRDVPPFFRQSLTTLDLQSIHALPTLRGHDITWGANYRRSSDDIDNSVLFAFLPAQVDQQWLSLFGQDEIALGRDVRFTLGARLERNDYTGTEFLPNLRLAWTLSPDHLLWAAASRAVRAPSRLDRDAFIPGVPPFLLDGGRGVRSELVDVYELGYRGQASARLSWSGTVFHADYDYLRSQEVAPSRDHLVFGNGLEGEASGIELWGKFQATPAWRLSAGATGYRSELWLKPGSNDVAGPLAAGLDPSHTWQLRSAWALGPRRDLDLAVRHVGALERNAVPAYTAVDLRFGWRLQERMELSITGLNLFGGHAEYGRAQFRTEHQPSVFMKLAWDH